MKNGLLIGAWLVGAVTFAIVSYNERCNKGNDGWGVVLTMTVGSLLWPAIAISRLAVFTWNPKYAMKPLGCPTAYTAWPRND